MNAQWDKVYIKALIDALKPTKSVLQVGFGSGFASNLIMSHHPKSLTIIENNKEIFSKAKAWASSHSHVTVIEGQWEDVLPTLGQFDSIFFNDICHKTTKYILEHEKEGRKALNKQQELFSMIEETFPDLTSITYSDHDLEEFYKKEGHLHKKETARFLSELKYNKQITEAQYEHFIKKHNLPQEEITMPLQDPLFLCFEVAKKHMHKGGKFTGISLHPLSKYESPLFFEYVITNPHLHYEEWLIPIEPTDHYEHNEALVILIEILE